MKFEIEAVLPNIGRGAVFARKIDGGDFSLSETALLEGVPIHPQVTCPRYE